MWGFGSTQAAFQKASDKLSPALLLQLAMKLGEYLKEGIDYYAAMKSANNEGVTPDVIAIFVSAKMQSWDPVLNGKHVLDDDTKRAAARFLAGVAFNFVGQ